MAARGRQCLGQAAERVARADAQDDVELAALPLGGVGLLEGDPPGQLPGRGALPRLLERRRRVVDADPLGIGERLERGEQPFPEAAAEIEDPPTLRELEPADQPA